MQPAYDRTARLLQMQEGQARENPPPPPHQQGAKPTIDYHQRGVDALLAKEEDVWSIDNLFCSLCRSKDAQPVPVDMVLVSKQHEEWKFGSKNKAADEWERLYLPPQFVNTDEETSRAIKNYLNKAVLPQNFKVKVKGHCYYKPNHPKHANKLRQTFFRCEMGTLRRKSTRTKIRSSSKLKDKNEDVCPFQLVVTYDPDKRRYFFRPRFSQCYTHKGHSRSSSSTPSSKSLSKEGDIPQNNNPMSKQLCATLDRESGVVRQSYAKLPISDVEDDDDFGCGFDGFGEEEEEETNDNDNNAVAATKNKTFKQVKENLTRIQQVVLNTMHPDDAPRLKYHANKMLAIVQSSAAARRRAALLIGQPPPGGDQMSNRENANERNTKRPKLSVGLYAEK